MRPPAATPRIALFHPDFTGLEDVEPLYRPGTFVYFDWYTDGDPYEDSAYIAQFQTILAAIHGRRQISVRFLGHTGRVHTLTCTPYRLEYSAKDDKFRLLAAGKRGSCIINLARICACTLREEDGVEPEYPERRTKELTLLLQDERNALERVLLHFSHFEKETQRREDGLYRMKLRYDEDDETELLIRVLSFGLMLRVCAPEEFKALLRERISRQMELQ